MLLLLAAIGMSIGILCFVNFLYDYYSWKKSRKDRPRISFRRFYDLYSKGSWRWKLYDDIVRFSSYPFEYYIDFESYLDVLKYKKFRKKATKEKLKEKQESNQKDLEKELDKMHEEVT